MTSSSSLLVLLIGAAMLLIAFGLREYKRYRHRSQLVAALSSAVPEERAKASDSLVGLGLAVGAGPLLAAMEQEQDPQVRMAAALSVGRRQWEPGNGRRAGALRAWSQNELLAHGYEILPFGPAFTRLSDMGGPRLPEKEHQGASAAAEGEVAAEPEVDGSELVGGGEQIAPPDNSVVIPEVAS